MGRSRTAVLAIAVGTTAMLAGCASQVDLSSIRREQRMLARRLADQRADLDRLNSEVSRLRGRSADSRYASGSTHGKPADRYAQGGYPPGTDTPPGGTAGRDYGTGTDYSGQPTTPPGTPPGVDPGSAGGGSAAGATPTPQGSGASNLQNDMARGNDGEYQQGLQSYSRGDYQRSVQSLRNYVSRNPRDKLVPVAQYWIGEAYFSQGKYNESILAFNEILVTWPDSDRKPAALLRQADAFARTGDKIDARMILQKLIEDHPGSPEAAEAKEQLRVLGG
ncbi:MAG: tol-pal system protein YbgF [Candidatus Binatia bacterium]|nr:tol-pal system protein YbgF [Candidatus Binatia bacterium]